jgi:hypothetical protein
MSRDKSSLKKYFYLAITLIILFSALALRITGLGKPASQEIVNSKNQEINGNEEAIEDEMMDEQTAINGANNQFKQSD